MCWNFLAKRRVLRNWVNWLCFALLLNSSDTVNESSSSVEPPVKEMRVSPSLKEEKTSKQWRKTI